MITILVFLLPFTDSYLEFAHSSEAEFLLYRFLSDQSPIGKKWDRYIGSDLVKGWYLHEVIKNPIIDSLLIEGLSRQVHRRHPVLALAYKRKGGISVAERLDPFSPDIPFYKLVCAISQGKLRDIVTLVQKIKEYLNDFYFQLFIVGNFLLFIYFTVFLAGIAILMVFLFRYLPVYIYNLGQYLPVPEIFRYIVAAVVILPFLFLTRNIVVVALIGAIPTLFFASRQERRWIKFILIWIILSLPVSYFVHLIVQTMRGSNKAGVIYRTLNFGYEKAIEKFHDPIAIFANAYISNLNGEWQKAESLYHRLIRIDRDDYKYLNNLGNIRFQLGDLDSAEILYRRAADLSQHSGIPFQNLANLYLKQLRFLDASRNFKIARERGAPDVDYIIDFRPPQENLWLHIFNFQFRFPFILSPYILILAIAIYILSMVISPYSVVNFCALCGGPITKESEIVDGPNHYCRGCGIKLQTARDENTRERILLQIRSRSMVWDRMRGIIFTFLLPGFAQIYSGRIGRGFLLALLPLFCYLFLYLSRPILITPYWFTPPLTSYLWRVLLPLILIPLILALIGVIGYGPRRQS
ncbi:hypothetical protein DRP53_04660 [candidate division WOR-3 bacterium]|uniref:Tetratricopeptide repeat protein n=1 Tax=candidate division WOR-3 bacterium TaxID=2052148 RepID=A0A660SK91_UNCW3|nr:MAG: hypothetical protein DRP53_04660 [candidate division WOR-3 bacterium]